MPNCSAVVRVHVAFVVDDYLAVDVKHSEEKERLRRWTSEWVWKGGISAIYDSFNTVSMGYGIAMGYESDIMEYEYVFLFEFGFDHQQ